MMATAMGPKNTLRDNGIIASTAAIAVRTMGRKRRTVASIRALYGVLPAAMSCSIWSVRMMELRMIMPDSAMAPSMATKPKGTRNTSRNRVMPIRPSGAVRNTIRLLEMLRNCSISKLKDTSRNSGTPAATEREPRLESSTVPPTSSR
jgi:hypothetical protein